MTTVHLDSIPVAQCSRHRHGRCREQRIDKLRLCSSSKLPVEHNVRRTQRPRWRSSVVQSISSTSDHCVDVVVVGSGVIGLSVAYTLLKQSKDGISVALVDGKGLCAGATGAGQGYIWLAHRHPSGHMFELARSSKQQWEGWVEDLQLLNGSDGNGVEVAEWQTTGSILLATTAAESADLQSRCAALRGVGVDATWLAAEDLMRLEPAVDIPSEGGGLRVPTDAQLNGVSTAKQLLAACQCLGKQPQVPSTFQLLFDTPVTSLLRDDNGHVRGVCTHRGRLLASRAVVVAAGAWSGQLLSECTGDERWREMFKPRRGHLLEVPALEGTPRVSHGLMENKYTKHYASTSSAGAASPVEGLMAGPADSAASGDADIVFTATSNASGSLLVGSSREFSGWDNSVDQGIVQAILERAVEYIPSLRHADLGGMTTRVGLRPFVDGGTPLVGPVPGHTGLYVAAGHEGSGLTLGPITAHIMSSYILTGDAESVTPLAAYLTPEKCCSL